jgi:hypothetical protein
LKERDHLEDLGLNGNIIKMDLKESLGEGWTGIDLAQDTAK